MKRIILLMTLCLTLQSVYAQKMRYDFKQGQVVKLNQDVDIKVEQNIQGTPMIINTDIIMESTFKVTEINDGVATLESAYDSLIMDMTINMFGVNTTVTVDSMNEPEQAEMQESHEMFKSMIGVPFYIFVNDRGKVIKTEGIEELAEKVYSVTSDPEAIQLMEQNFGPEKLKNDYARLFAFYPESKLKNGSTYSNNVTIKDFGITDQEQQWTVSKVEGQKDQLALTSTMPVEMVKTENNIDINLSGDLTTDFVVDTKTGWPMSNTMSGSMEGNAHTVNEALGGDVTWPMSMTMKGVNTFVME